VVLSSFERESRSDSECLRVLRQMVTASVFALDLNYGQVEHAAVLALEAGVDLKGRPEERLAELALRM